MHGPFALGAEVFDRFHYDDAEEHLPQAVDGAAGGERVGAVDEPACQAEAIVRRARRQRGHGGGEAGRYFRAFLVVLAAQKDVDVARRGHFFHDHGGRDAIVEVGEVLLSLEKSPVCFTNVWRWTSEPNRKWPSLYPRFGRQLKKIETELSRLDWRSLTHRLHSDLRDRRRLSDNVDFVGREDTIEDHDLRDRALVEKTPALPNAKRFLDREVLIELVKDSLRLHLAAVNVAADSRSGA